MRQIVYLGLILPMLFVLVGKCNAQEVQRPAIWGIAKITFWVSDLRLTRDYYGKFLGFDEAFSYLSDLGKISSFKVNDRQFLEFVVDKQAKDKKRMVSVSFETENVEQMRQYLKSKGLTVPDKTTIDGAGNEIFVVNDPSENHIEFIGLKATGLHKKTKGKYLSVNRISKRIHHVGLFCKEVEDNDSFYAGILGFKELWRYPEAHTEKVQINYLQIPDCVENVEHYPSPDVNFNHPCFLVEDMQETIYTLHERRGNNQLAKPIVGKGKRWLLNIQNEDGTKTEFTEAHAVR